MKILLVNDYGTPTAGAERITRNLRDGLRDRGHIVRIFASRAQLIPGETIADATCFGTNARLQTLSSAVNLSAARALQRELRSFTPDVVQVQMFLWQLSPAILPVLRHLPSVYYAMTFKAVCPTGLKWLPSGAPCRDVAGSACLRNGCLTPAGFGPRMLQRFLWRKWRRDFTAVVACSHAVRSFLEDDNIAVRDVIWPGTPTTVAREKLSEPPIVTFSGRLVREKGVDTLVHAFAHVRDHLPQAQLHIAGAGPERAAICALSAELGQAGSVHLHGQLEDVALDALLRRSWVHAVPSRWPEPFGMTVTEAMMRGTAVVASGIGGLVEIVEPGVTGLHAPPGDVPALAQALTQLLSNPSLAEAMGAKARERALEHFDLSHFAVRFEALYESLLEPSTHESRAQPGFDE